MEDTEETDMKFLAMYNLMIGIKILQNWFLTFYQIKF